MPVNRVRFAPSPTGELHIGGARTALFNYLFARSTGGVFVLRIDDTDLERSRPEYIDKLLASIAWLGLEWDEGPYYQSRRLALYSREAAKLLSSGKAYHCYCSPEDLERGRAAARKDNRTYLYPGTCRHLIPEQEQALLNQGIKPVMRLVTPGEGETGVRDLIRGEVCFDNTDLDDFIIIKANGLPTYNFASIVDDLDMKISHVIRAEEHLSNTPRQQLCAVALERELPIFAHVPMILAPDRSKLSKRHGATSVEEFRLEGYLPEALVNYMALLGWSPGDDEEVVPLAAMIDRFDLRKVGKHAAVYDTGKLGWMNGVYLRSRDPELILESALPYFEERGLVGGNRFEDDYLKRVIVAVRERARTLPELAELSEYFFREPAAYDSKGEKKHFAAEEIPSLLRHAADNLKNLDPFNPETTEKTFNKLCEKMGISTGRLIQPTRLALTGRTAGPGLFEIISILGRNTTTARLEKAAAYVESRL